MIFSLSNIKSPGDVIENQLIDHQSFAMIGN